MTSARLMTVACACAKRGKLPLKSGGNDAGYCYLEALLRFRKAASERK